MFGLVEDMAEARFWDNWESRFNLNGGDYIKPYRESVVEASMNLDIPNGLSDVEVARKVSSWIAKHHDYKLEKRWRRPEQTLADGKGDCEDYVFLLGSMLPNFGVKEFTVAIGSAHSHGQEEFHVWMEVGDEVVDPTAKKFGNYEVRYEPKEKFDIEINGM